MKCFLPTQPGKIKLILSTNIAQSGITINDVGAVIDCGRSRQLTVFVDVAGEKTELYPNSEITYSGNTNSQLMSFNSGSKNKNIFANTNKDNRRKPFDRRNYRNSNTDRGGNYDDGHRFGARNDEDDGSISNSNNGSGDYLRMGTKLMTVYASKANCIQRRGRVGRTRPGICIRLYTRTHFNALRDFQLPEMLRLPLEGTCLHILALKLGEPVDFLHNALQPPNDEHIESAMTRLRDLGAINELRQITALGYRLAQLPVQPNIGKILIMGSIFRVLDSALTVAASKNCDVFLTAREEREVIRMHRESMSKKTMSDKLATVNGYNY